MPTEPDTRKMFLRSLDEKLGAISAAVQIIKRNLKDMDADELEALYETVRDAEIILWKNL